MQRLLYVCWANRWISSPNPWPVRHAPRAPAIAPGVPRPYPLVTPSRTRIHHGHHREATRRTYDVAERIHIIPHQAGDFPMICLRQLEEKVHRALRFFSRKEVLPQQIHVFRVEVLLSNYIQWYRLQNRIGSMGCYSWHKLTAGFSNPQNYYIYRYIIIDNINSYIYIYIIVYLNAFIYGKCFACWYN